MTQKKIISMLNSQNALFPPSLKHDCNRNRKKRSYSSGTSFCTQRKVNYKESGILGLTAWTWGFSLCPFITFCWLASPSCNIPTILTGQTLTRAWLPYTPNAVLVGGIGNSQSSEFIGFFFVFVVLFYSSRQLTQNKWVTKTECNRGTHIILKQNRTKEKKICRDCFVKLFYLFI